METFSALLAFCAKISIVTGEYPSQRPVTRSFDVLFDPRLEKGLSKQPRYRWFETPSCSLLRPCNALIYYLHWFYATSTRISRYLPSCNAYHTGSAFIKPDQLDPWIKDQIKITLLPTISHLQLPNVVSCGRACPSHTTQNLVSVGAKL